MNIYQLKYFLEVDKFNNFSMAAEELCISQSALSKQIKSLETHIGTKLFERTTRNLKLTSAGEEFKESAKKILKEYSIMNDTMKKYTDSNIETIELATIPVVTQYNLTCLIVEFQNKYPNIKVNLRELEYDNIMSLYDKSEINLSFIRTDYLHKHKLVTIPLIQDELVLATPKNHPLANKKYVSLSDLSHENFIFLGSESGVYELCIDACKNAGFSPVINYSSTRLETLMGLVSAGLGVTLLMNKVISYFNNNDISIILLKENIKSTLALAYTDDSTLSKNDKLFRDFIIHKYNKNKY